MQYKMDADKLYCCYCGEQILFLSQLTIEHIVAKSKGGNNTPLNKTPCCKSCNSQKGNKYLDVWLKELVKKSKRTTNKSVLYKLEAMIENVKYWIDYVEGHGDKLLTHYHIRYRKNFEVWEMKNKAA